MVMDKNIIGKVLEWYQNDIAYRGIVKDINSKAIKLNNDWIDLDKLGKTRIIKRKN
jgi:hypothetical protein